MIYILSNHDSPTVFWQNMIAFLILWLGFYIAPNSIYSYHSSKNFKWLKNNCHGQSIRNNFCYEYICNCSFIFYCSYLLYFNSKSVKVIWLFILWNTSLSKREIVYLLVNIFLSLSLALFESEYLSSLLIELDMNIYI